MLCLQINTSNLVTDLLAKLPSWVDVIVGDALYFNAPFVKEVLKNGKHAVIRLKDKTSSAYKTIDHTAMYNETEGSFVVNEPYSEVTVSYWKKDTRLTDSTLLKHDPGKHVEIRLYKFIEVIETNIKGEQKFTFREVFVGTTDKNMTPQSVWKIIRKRWYIENTCFNQLKTYCFMEHCFRHDETAIEAILGIMFMAFNIIQSYLFRRTRRFKENFRRKKETISWFTTELLYEFVTLSHLCRCKLLPHTFLYNP